MNKVILTGRLTAEPELKYTSNDKAYTRFTLAVNRNFKKENGESEADFISVIAWEKRAETICKYVKKGNKIGIDGRIQTGSYDKEDGNRGYLTDVIVNGLEFLESKSKDDRPASDYRSAEEEKEVDPFADFGDSVQLSDDDLPF